jgi:hypothetical protein
MTGTASQPEWLWTWSGELFGRREGDDLWARDGRHVGQFEGDEIYGADGRYLGEVLGGNRLITARSRRWARRAIFVSQPRRARSRRRNRLPAHPMPTGYEDFPAPEKLP